MKVAIVGSGVSGLVTAYLLHPRHDITIFEAEQEPGGHVRTVVVDDDVGATAVDTGFIVYNESNYPLFTRLIRRLGVATQPTTMSFSVRLDQVDLEYNGSTLTQLVGQRKNLLRPSFYRMAADIVRFNRLAPAAVRNGSANATLGELVEAHDLSPAFRDHYLVPVGAALWSAPPRQVLSMPAAFFVRFFENHGMLTIDNRPAWRVIAGGSRQYVERLIAPFRDRLRCSTPVHRVERSADFVTVNGERFDQVVLACHSDQALAMLSDPTGPERDILGALPYQPNDVILHRDPSLLPRRRQLWGAWNYHAERADQPVAVTYLMNQLQTLTTKATWCVSLNAAERIDAATIVSRATMQHPVFTPAGIAAQARHREISGVNRTHYCGAYWGFGFHEDGVASAVAVGERFGVTLDA